LREEEKRRNSHREPRRKFTPSQLFFSPSSSLQLTGKPFDNMSNTGE
jgi:hypothetical protein